LLRRVNLVALAARRRGDVRGHATVDVGVRKRVGAACRQQRALLLRGSPARSAHATERPIHRARAATSLGGRRGWDAAGESVVGREGAAGHRHACHPSLLPLPGQETVEARAGRVGRATLQNATNCAP
jgi:hypothetical protein